MFDEEPVINPILFAYLCKYLGQTGSVLSAGEQATFTCPANKHTRIGRSSRKTKIRKLAYADKWGEKYQFNCPVCGDTRGRLIIGHLFRGRIQINSTEFFFGNLARCYNEKCDVQDLFGKFDLDWAKQNITIESKPTAFTKWGEPCNDYPEKTIPLIDPELPYVAVDYLHGRKFSLPYLHEYFAVTYAPKGTQWTRTKKVLNAEGEEVEEKEVHKFFDNRIIIPILQRRQMTSWQARVADPEYVGKTKYLFGSGNKKSEYIYNMDNALFHKDICLFEGVTDVWRYGHDSVNIFGKSISSVQIEILRILWGWAGWKATCVVCLDPGEDEAEKKIIKKLRDAGIFHGGVVGGGKFLESGKDPADHDADKLRELMDHARLTCL